MEWLVNIKLKFNRKTIIYKLGFKNNIEVINKESLYRRVYMAMKCYRLRPSCVAPSPRCSYQEAISNGLENKVCSVTVIKRYFSSIKSN